MYVVTLDQNDITWLAFAAGIATGSGNDAAKDSLYGILSRVMEVPGNTDAIAAYSAAEDVPDAATPDPEDFEGTLDPNFMPPVAPPPSRPSDEFGPGHGQGGVTGTPIA